MKDHPSIVTIRGTALLLGWAWPTSYGWTAADGGVKFCTALQEGIY